MASYQVLPAGPSFGGGLLQGFNNASDVMNSYNQSLFKDKIDKSKEELKRQRRLKDYENFHKQFDPEKFDFEYVLGPEGMKTTAKTRKEDFGTMAKRAISGEFDYNTLKKSYPAEIDKINKMENEFTPSVANPNFTEGTGSPVSRVKSLFSKNQAELTAQTKMVIGNIKSKADLDEFINDQEEYANQGVDVNAVLEYFGKR